MKYIIVDQCGSFFDVPFFFPEVIPHDVFAAPFSGNVSSAGVITFAKSGNEVGITVKSGSRGLQINGNGEQDEMDAKILRRYLEFKVEEWYLGYLRKSRKGFPEAALHEISTLTSYEAKLAVFVKETWTYT